LSEIYPIAGPLKVKADLTRLVKGKKIFSGELYIPFVLTNVHLYISL